MPQAAFPERPIVLRCAWCDRFLVDGRWLPEGALGPGGRRGFPVSHGICPGCAAGVQAGRGT